MVHLDSHCFYNKHHILFPYDSHTNLLTKHTVSGSFYLTIAITPPPQLTPFFAQAWFAAYSSPAIATDPITSEESTVPLSLELLPHSNLTATQHE